MSDASGSAAAATSVVVSTYDERRWPDLVACVRSLREQTQPPLEVIVVVDQNPALLERAAAAFDGNGARAIPNARARGLAGSRNTGAAAARGEIVAFIDDDATADPGWLAEMETGFRDAAIVGAGGALVPRWQGAAPRWLPSEFHWALGCSYTGLPERPAPIRNPIGANMAVRRAALMEVGGFREGRGRDAPREIHSRGVVRAGGNVPDDTDLAIRVSRRFPGAVWLYQPAARVHHTVTRERASFGYFVRRCYEEGAGKARLARLLGPELGLSSERRQLAVVLPRGIARAWRDLLRGDLYAPLRTLAIVLGAAVTATGFVAAHLGRFGQTGR